MSIELEENLSDLCKSSTKTNSAHLLHVISDIINLYDDDNNNNDDNSNNSNNNNNNECLKYPDRNPSWLANGTTYLLPKNEETHNPTDYRPIICLPTMYKILTSILSDTTCKHMMNNNLPPVEQKGSRKGSFGCKEQLLINKAIMEDAKARKKNLATGWVDYKKAFDSVPHSWILKCLEMYNISQIMKEFIESSMKIWKTILYLSHEEGTLTSREINIIVKEKLRR